MNGVNRFIGKQATWIVMAAYLACFFWLKNPSDPWDRVISSDGKGYYAYLPALFIYQDLSFSFIDSYENRYYPKGGNLYKDFRVSFSKGVADKYFPGLAILWLPFFLIGHLMALATGVAPDGYSMPYQLAIAASAFVYLFAGLLVLKKVLSNYSSSEILVGWIILLTGLATNLVYYTIVEGSMVHVYNFFLVNAFVFLILRATEKQEKRFFIVASAVLGLIIITRPQNGLVVLSVPFLAGSISNLRQTAVAFIQRPSCWLYSLIAGFLILSVPMIIWYIQTGSPVVYTYGNEHFNLTHPQLGKFLFGFEKGWFVYTPLAAISLFGFINLYKSSRYRFLMLAAFLTLLLCVMSSWWVWHYTSQHSQRVMIDFFVFFAILLVYLFRKLMQGRVQIAVSLLFILLIAMNLLQLYQQKIWVYPRGPVTASAYFSNFFSLKPDGTFYIPEESVVAKVSFFSDFESAAASFNTAAATKNPGAFSGEFCLEPDTARELMLFSKSLISERNSAPMLLKVGGMFLKNNDLSGIRIGIAYGKNGDYYGQSERSVSASMNAGEWSYAEYVSYLPYIRSVFDSVFIYLESEEAMTYADDLHIEFLAMRPGERNDWFGTPAEITDENRVMKFDMEGAADDCWKSTDKVSSGVAYSGSRSCRIDSGSAYSILFEDSLHSFYGSKDGYIRVAASIKTGNTAKPVLVFDYRDETGQIKYKAIPVEKKDKTDEWIVQEFFDELPVKKAELVRIYFWHTAGDDPCYIDDFEVEYVGFLPKNHVPEPDLAAINKGNYLLTVCNDFEKPSEGSSPKIAEYKGAPSGEHITFMDEKNRFSYAIKMPVKSPSGEPSTGVVITAKLYSDCFYSNAALVADYRHNGISVSYNPLYLRGLNKKGKWVWLGHQALLPAGTAADTVIVYFYLPHGSEQLMVDDICVRLLPLQAGKKAHPSLQSR